MSDVALLEASGIDLVAQGAFERLELGDEGLPSYEWAGTDAAIEDANTYRTMAERNLWAIAAVCHSLERVTGRFNEHKGEVIDGDIKKFCAETGFAKSRVYHLSRAYGLASKFVSDVRQRTSLNLLSVSHFEEASALEPQEAIKALEWALDNGVNGSPAPVKEVRRLVQGIKTDRFKVADGDETRKAETTGHIRELDALEFLHSLDDAEADLLLTDPPYMTDVADVAEFAATWLPVALRKVAPTGRAYVCTGAYPLELQVYLNASLRQNDFTLENILVWTYRNTLGPSPAKRYKMNWQAVFYFTGKDAPPLDSPVMTEQFSVQDINAPDGRLGDRYHAWQKPYELARRFIEHSTKPGQLVIDPFAGTGTFLGMAARLGRHGLGSEIDPKMLALCEDRGLEVSRAR